MAPRRAAVLRAAVAVAVLVAYLFAQADGGHAPGRLALAIGGCGGTPPHRDQPVR